MRALRRTESAVLVALGVLLAVAVGRDIERQSAVTRIFHADARVLDRYVHVHAHRAVFHPRFYRYRTHVTGCADAGFDSPVRLCVQIRRVDGRPRAVGGWRATVPPGRPGPKVACFGLAARRDYCGPDRD